jgi:superfamily II RNA helicase
MGERIYEIYPLSFHFHQTEEWRKKEALQLLKGRVDLLKDMGYIQGGKLSLKAELASQVYSFELTVGELFEKGFFESLGEESLFIVITALVYEPRKNDFRPPLNKQLKKLRNDLSFFTRDIQRIEKKFKVNPLSKIFYFHLSEAGRAWFQEKDFYKVTQICKADEGEIVRYFRMGIQVLREIYHCPAVTASLKAKVFNCLKRINRDVVDAEKQLRQEI